MALTTNNLATSADIMALKNRVKNEMTKRCNTGSLSDYGGDFSINASVGSLIKTAHYNETVGYISKISAINDLTTSKSAGDMLQAIGAAAARLA